MADDPAPSSPPQPEGDHADTFTFGPTVTIFFSDIRGFTEYTDAHGDTAAYRMLQHHNTLVQEQIALYTGHIVKTLGDSYMVAFDSARNALACAIGVQRQLAQYNTSQQGPKVEIGIGINTGEPIREGNDLFGGSVNLASRICAVSGAGRILVSEAVRALVGRLEGADYIDRGYYEIKGFAEPQHLFEVDWSGVGAVRATQVAPPARRTAAEQANDRPVSTPSPQRRLPVLIGGAMLGLVVILGGAFLLWRNVGAPPSPPATAVAAGSAVAKPAPTGVAPAASAKPAASTVPAGSPAAAAKPSVAQAPLRLLQSDDFSDPARGQFRDKLQNTQRNPLNSTLTVQYPWDASYSDGALVTHIKGPYQDNPQRLPLGVQIDSLNRVQDNFAVEIAARATLSAGQSRYGLIFDQGGEDYLIFTLNVADGQYLAGYGRTGATRRILSSGRSTAARSGSEENILRLEVHGEAVRLSINGQELTPAQLPTAPQKAGVIAVQMAMLGPLAEGDLEVRFDNYKLFTSAP